MQGILDYALESIDKAKSAGEINEIVDSAIEEMNETPHFKVEYEATLKEIMDGLQKIIDENIAEYEWLETRNLTSKKDEIINDLKSKNKYLIVKNSDEYISDTLLDFGNYVNTLVALYPDIQSPIQTLNNHYNGLPLEYYGVDEKANLDNIYENAINALETLTNKEEIEEIVNTAISEMNKIPNFKTEYMTITKEISDSIQAKINEKVKENEWFAKRNLETKKDTILSNIESIDKYEVYKNSDTYVNNAIKEFNDYIVELDLLYTKITEAIATINDCDSSGKKVKKLIQEYIEKVELAENQAHVDELMSEFKEEYNKLTENGLFNCSSGAICFMNLFAVLSLALIILRKKQ